jgi:hypothetical protein
MEFKNSYKEKTTAMSAAGCWYNLQLKTVESFIRKIVNINTDDV